MNLEEKLLKEFDEKFTHDRGWAIEDDGYAIKPKDIKKFLLKAIKQAKEEGRKGERKRMWKELPKYHTIKSRGAKEDYWTGYNHAIAIMDANIQKS